MKINEETELISDEEIERIHGNADFGEQDKRDVVREGVLKHACGYYSGSTATAILKAHKLITNEYKLTFKGQLYLWETFAPFIK